MSETIFLKIPNQKNGSLAALSTPLSDTRSSLNDAEAQSLTASQNRPHLQMLNWLNNVMGNSASANKISAQDKAILDMKNQRDKLHQYQRRITVLTDREKEIAKQMLAKGDKSRALLALRRKKYQESLLAKTDAQLEQLEKLTSSVEFALVQKDVVFGLQQGTNVLKEIHKEMGGIEHVEKLMGETADAIAYQQEVSDMLGGRISNQDEDEVEDELEALEAEVMGVPLPEVPTTDLPRKERAKARQREREEQQRVAMLA